MKLLLITESDELQDRIAREFRPHQVEIIQYWSPLKGMDNLDEVAPDVVIFSAVDFPRHWKTFLMFLRNSYARDRIIFVLLVSESFDANEASKAQHLGVNAVIDASLQSRQDLNRLRDIITRYKRLDESRSDYRHTPDELDDIDFLFSHPRHLRLIPGTVEDISTTGIRFSPHRPQVVQDLDSGSLLTSCSLRVGGDLLTINCTVVRNTESLALTFEEMDEAARQRIAEYLENHTERAIEHASS
ncbi:MAG: PilZ domain-containing protein [Spirochaetes bacterium]|jgi:DNA-binding response OmpR family regulator|nr:PilZ domain-containing protein [Spirochaetota bacterium]